MNKTKIINDPIYGFVSFADSILIRILDHAYFQRLHRIQQLGLAHLVFPGATHTRLHHCIGAFYLMQTALSNLRMKGVEISESERLACSIAILLHDSGHTPLSHTLERIFLGDYQHEQLSAMVMAALEAELAHSKIEREAFQLAQQIFQNQYSRAFFYQLISSQIDVDRMDYLTRDSFYTGVAEGIIGYKRILQTLQVDSCSQSLVIEDKGIYAVEKFLIARYFMHRQVYSHKNVWVWSMLMQRIFARVTELLAAGANFANLSENLAQLCRRACKEAAQLLPVLLATDDCDVWYFLKTLQQSTQDVILRILSAGIFQRKLYKIQDYVLETEQAVDSKIYTDLCKEVAHKYGVELSLVQRYLILSGPPEIPVYSQSSAAELGILFKDGQLSPISEYYALLKHLPAHSESPKRIYYAYPVL